MRLRRRCYFRLFTNNLLLYDVKDLKSLVDLSNWASLTYPDSYIDMTSLSDEDITYLSSVSASSVQEMMRYCASMEELDLNFLDTKYSNQFNSMFSDCHALTSLNVSDLDTRNAETMGGMFWRCENLESLDLSKWDTHKCTIFYQMFTNCYNIKCIDLSKFDTRAAEGNMWAMFLNCDSLEYLIINTENLYMWDENCGGLNTTCKILVPQELLNTYTTATNWSSRASQFDAIENYIITRENGQVTVTPAMDVGQSPLRINIPQSVDSLDIGSDHEYPVEVTNTSDYELSNIEIENESSGEVLRTSTLSSKKSFRRTDNIIVTEADILYGNVGISYDVSADSEDPNNSSISFTSTPYTYITDPINSSLEITFDEDNTYYYEGNTITAYLNVVNDGNVTLTNIHINVAATGDSYTLSSLEPGETFYRSLSYTATSGDATSGAVYISASITADSPDTNNPTVTFSGGYSYRVVRRYRLTVYYVDTDGNTVANTFTNTYVSGDEYNVTSPTFEGMRADYDRVRGTITDSDVTVTVTYTAITYGLSIRYVYLDGTTAAPDYYGEFAHDSNYSVTSPAIQGYTPDYAVVSGTMPARDVIMTVIYTANPNSNPNS